MNDVIETVLEAAPELPSPNRFTPDALDRMARLRAMAADFPDTADRRPLKQAERALARSTSVAALEKAAVFAEVAPGLGSSVGEVALLREAIAFEMAYISVRDEALALARYIDQAILRRKYPAAVVTRGLYRLGKGFVTLDAGDPVRTHVSDMKRALVRRKKVATAPEAPEAKK